MKQEIVNINVYDIIPNRFQPRQRFDDNKLNELANSIRKYGIICPLILRKLDNKYEIIAGERRYKAALIVGLKTVPSIVLEVSDQESAELALIENVQREDLSSIEEAKSYDNLLKNESVSKEQISQSISKNIATIENKLKLLDLSEKAKDALLHNLISEGHAKVLLKLNEKNRQNELLEKIMSERLNVKEASEEVKIMNNQYTNNTYSNDMINLKELENDDIVSERNNINNALNQINIDNENEKGDNFMNNEFNNMNMNNGGLNNFANEPSQNQFFPSLEDQTVNFNAPQPEPNNGFNIPEFNSNQFDNNINNQPNIGMPEPNTNPFMAPDMNNQNPFMAPPISEQGMQPINNDFSIPQNNNQMPINEFNNIPSVEPQNNPFVTPEMNNPFGTQPEQNNNPFGIPDMNNQNPFQNQETMQPMNNNPFDMNQAPTIDMTQPMNSAPEMNPMNNPFQMETPQQSMDTSYGAGFATQVNQPNPAIDKIKILVDELRNNGFNIELSEADLMDSFQLTINIKK